MSPRLTVLFSTIDDRIKQLLQKELPIIPEVRYLVVWQRTKPTDSLEHLVEDSTKKQPMDVIRLEGKGISRSRNAAIKALQTEFAIFSDDDVEYTEEQLKMVIQAFDEQSFADILLFQMSDYEGHLMKNYPSFPYDYRNTPKRTFVSSCEIAFRKTAAIPFFDERFGLGSDYLTVGEEEVFIHEAASKGLNITYIPKVVCRTNPSTTSKRLKDDDKFWRSKGAVNYMLHGKCLSVMKAAKYAFVSPYSRTVHRFCEMLKGINYVANTNHKK